MTEDFLETEFRTLCDAVIGGRASAEQIRELEQLVLSSSNHKRQYVEAMHLHSTLCLMAEEFGGCSSLSKISEPQLTPRQHGVRRFRVVTAILTLVVVSVLLTAFVFRFVESADSTFATLVGTESCRWDFATLPTQVGKRIGKGRFGLAEGLATIQFDNGARVDLEGPADFETISAIRCRIHRGKLVATMETELKGFVVETPNAVLVDQGTSFGVNVESAGVSEVAVFDGKVDVSHRHTGEEKVLLANSSVRFLPDEIVSIDSQRGFVPDALSSVSNERQFVQISTATGKGREHWIQGNESVRKGSDNLLLAKNCFPLKPGYHWYDRRIFIGFDLSTVNVGKIREASLSLTGAPTGLGYASRASADTFFAIYGLTDDSLDDWSAESMIWETAPASADGDGSAIDQTKAEFLGRFKVRRGQRGVFSIEGSQLLEFLQNDQNRFATLIIVCETSEIKSGAFVHGFAGRYHESLAPPTLKLWFDKE